MNTTASTRDAKESGQERRRYGREMSPSFNGARGRGNRRESDWNDGSERIFHRVGDDRRFKDQRRWDSKLRDIGRGSVENFREHSRHDERHDRGRVIPVRGEPRDTYMSSSVCGDLGKGGRDRTGSFDRSRGYGLKDQSWRPQGEHGHRGSRSGEHTLQHQRQRSRPNIDEPSGKRFRGAEGKRFDTVACPEGDQSTWARKDVKEREKISDNEVNDDNNNFFTLNTEPDFDISATKNGNSVARDNVNAATLKCQETDPHRIKMRQKQIDKGYNTLGYARYLELVPKARRGLDKNRHPRTPDPYQVCSKRSYDGQIRKWRRLLHEYDPPEEDDEEVVARPVIPEVYLNSGQGRKATPTITFFEALTFT